MSCIGQQNSTLVLHSSDALMSLTVVYLSKGMHDKEIWTVFVDRIMMEHKSNQPLKPVKKTLDARPIQFPLQWSKQFQILARNSG
jgi:hypothetical protein